MNKESNLEKKLAKELENLNIFSVHLNAEGVKGIPDRLVIAPLGVLFVEIKLGKENKSYYGLSPIQELWRKQIQNAQNTSYFLIDSEETYNIFISYIKSELVYCKENNRKYINYLGGETDDKILQ